MSDHIRQTQTIMQQRETIEKLERENARLKACADKMQREIYKLERKLPLQAEQVSRIGRLI